MEIMGLKVDKPSELISSIMAKSWTISGYDTHVLQSTLNADGRDKMQGI